MKNLLTASGLLIALSLTIACQPKIEKKQIEELIIQGQAQGTTYTVKYLGEKYAELPSRLDSLLKSIDHSLSTYDTSSIITALNAGDTVAYDDKLWMMTAYSKWLTKETSGAFDPTIGPLIRAWGWDLSEAESMDSSKVDSLLALKGYDKLELGDSIGYWKQKASVLNFNAIAQGYSIDLMCMLLEEYYGIQNYYVELGGELKVKGRNAKGEFWRIGIDRPIDENQGRELIAIIDLEDAAMATSGNYRKFYEIDGKKYSHTIDPESGYPVQHSLLSATVISKDCYRADALATAFMVMGVDKAKEFLKKSDDLAYLIYAEEDGSYGFFVSQALQAKVEEIPLDTLNQ
ncbi:MAG: thiamine biosynthesis protein ApbE [Flavobacteriales bacterium]|nr:thiamine biosynthesis protein ApbE [Flavobacteriales bacterium]